MPYCPICKAEYKEGITTCADCGVELVDEPPAEELDVRDFMEFYACTDTLEAGRLRDILEAAGMKVLVRDMGISAFPTAIGSTAEKRLAVAEDRLDEAVKVVKTAIADGEVSPDGRFIGPAKNA